MRRTPVICSVVVAVAGAFALSGCGGTTTVVTITTGGQTTGPETTAPTTPGTTTGGDTQGAPTDTTAERTTLTALPTAPTQTATVPTETSSDPDDVLVDRPADFPNGGEKYLLARLDPDVARRCTRQRADSLSRGAVAGLYCDTSGALGATAFYDLFPNRARLDASYGRYRRGNNVPLAQGQCVPGADKTPSSIPAEGTWNFARRPGVVQGRVMCFKSDDKVWLVTSHEAIRTLSFFSATRRKPVNDFWYGPGFPTTDPR